MADFVFGFEVHGLRHPTVTTNTAPVLFVTRSLDLSALSEFSGHNTFALISREDVSGFNWSSDPRRLVGSGGQCSVKILDKEGTLGTQFLRNARTGFFDIESSRIEQGATTLRVTGKPGSSGALPTQNQIYWIEGEAIQVASAPSLVAGAENTYDMTIVRGRCGSRDVLHRIDPLAASLNGPGIEDRLYLDERPNIAAYLFTGALYLFRLDQFGAAIDYIKRYVTLTEPPTPQTRRKWEFRFRDIGALLAEHEMGHKGREVTLSHKLRCVQVNEPGYAVPGVSGAVSSTTSSPAKIVVSLTRQEAENFFREPLREPGTEKLSAAMVSSLATRLTASPKVAWYCEVDCSGKYLFKMSGVPSYQERARAGDPSTSLTPFVEFSCDLIDKEDKAAVKDEDNDFAPGWWYLPAWPVGQFGESDTVAPKVALRCVLQTTPIQAMLALCCSDGASSSDAYDILPGRVGLGLPSDWFNLGTPAGNPLTNANVESPELLVRDQLLDETFFYHLPLKTEAKLGDFLSADICVLHCLLFGPLQNGKFTVMPWARTVQSISARPPVVNSAEIEPGTKLERIRVLEISSGYRPLTLTPEFFRYVVARDVRARGSQDLKDIQRARIWQPGHHLADQEVTQGALSTLVRSFLDMYGGAPIAYQVPTSMSYLITNAIEFGVVVPWSNTDVLSSEGVGVNANFLVFGYNLNWRTGEVTLRLIEDTYNTGYVTLAPGADGKTSPALRPIRVVAVSSGVYQVEVEPIGAAAGNLASLYASIFTTMIGVGLVRITRAAHNPILSTEREGHLEAYATVTAHRYDSGTKRSWLTLTVDSAWEREGKTVMRDLIVPRESLITLCDRRVENTHPASGTIEPMDAMRYEGFTKVSGRPFDKTVHLFGA